MNRFRLTGARPVTAFAALATCSSMPRSVRRAVGLVLVEHPLVAQLRGWPGGPGLGEYVPVGDVLAGVLALPLRHLVGDVRDLHAEDERQARGIDGLLVRLGDHPGVRDDRDVEQPVSGHVRPPAAAAPRPERCHLLLVMREPRCSMLREPRRNDHTICTAVAPEAVFTART